MHADLNASEGSMIELDDTLQALDDGHLDFLYCTVCFLPEGDAFSTSAFDDGENFRRLHQASTCLLLARHVAGWSFLLRTASCPRVLLDKIRNLTV